jgi:hypothetical protein
MESLPLMTSRSSLKGVSLSAAQTLMLAYPLEFGRFRFLQHFCSANSLSINDQGVTEQLLQGIHWDKFAAYDIETVLRPSGLNAELLNDAKQTAVDREQRLRAPLDIIGSFDNEGSEYMVCLSVSVSESESGCHTTGVTRVFACDPRGNGLQEMLLHKLIPPEGGVQANFATQKSERYAVVGVRRICKNSPVNEGAGLVCSTINAGGNLVFVDEFNCICEMNPESGSIVTRFELHRDDDDARTPASFPRVSIATDHVSRNVVLCDRTR